MTTLQWLKESKEQLESDLNRSKIIIDNHMNGVLREESKMDRTKEDILEVSKAIEILERELKGELLGNVDNPGKQETKNL